MTKTSRQSTLERLLTVCKGRDVTRRSFFGTAAAASAALTLPGCVDSDTGDTCRSASDSDISRADSDPNDPIRYGDPSRARCDSDTGD